MCSKQQMYAVSLGACSIGVIIGLSLQQILKSQSKKETKQKYIDYQSEQYQQLVKEQLVRSISFYGEEGQKSIQNSFIIIAGIGGVGSHLCVALARAGVQKIRIIDFDRITLSSLNRHGFATRNDVGKSKAIMRINLQVLATKEYINNIFPHIEIECYENYITPENTSKFLEGNPTYVIDAIDNIDAKVSLLAYCVKNNLRVISAGGAGMKCDPTRIQISDISETNYDDLSRAVRRKLKVDHGIQKGFNMIYSTERTKLELLPLKEHQIQNVDDYRIFDNYRLRVIPVMSTMPAAIGLTIATKVLSDLADYKQFQPFSIDEVKYATYAKLYHTIIEKEKKHGRHSDDIEYDIEDLYVLARQAQQWTCPISGKQYVNLEPIRWNPEEPASITNILLINKKYIKQHQELINLNQIKAHYSEDIYSKCQYILNESLRLRQKGEIIYK